MIKPAFGSLLIIFGLLLSQATAKASVNPIPQLPGSQQVGAGELTWFGMTVYQASLFAAAGEYQPDLPHALKIDYAFSFSAYQLAKQSLKEIERIHGKQPDRDSLVEQLQAVFSDVKKGVHILGIHYPGQGASFYSAGELLGRLDNSKLAEMFFDIWLNSATREPRLRNQLLGSRQ